MTRQVADGTLPDLYELPELSVLLERAVSLATTCEIMARNNWEPNVVFVPRRLSLEQWNVLLTGHRPDHHSWSEGLHRTWTGCELAHPTNHEAEYSPWGVAVSSGAERPVLVDVSKDGKHGFNGQGPSRRSQSCRTLAIRHRPKPWSSPTEERYFTLQLARHIR